jgi:hypothetical protein
MLPSRRATSTVLGATNRPVPKMNSAPSSVILHIHLVQADHHLALAVSDARHLNREAIVSNAKLFASARVQPEEFNLVILGGGTGSTVAAWTFAGEGKRVAVVDRKLYWRLLP